MSAKNLVERLDVFLRENATFQAVVTHARECAAQKEKTRVLARIPGHPSGLPKVEIRLAMNPNGRRMMSIFRTAEHGLELACDCFLDRTDREIRRWILAWASGREHPGSKHPWGYRAGTARELLELTDDHKLV